MRLLQTLPGTAIYVSIVVLLLSVAANGHAADPGLKENAALQYWKAFSFLPKLDEEQEKLISNWQTVPLDAHVDELLAASQTSLMFLHRGAQLKRCDWGLDDSDGVGMLLPHLAQARTLALVAALHGRRALEQGHRIAARQNATSVMALARHVGHDPIMIALVVQYALEGLVVDLVAPHVPDLKVSHADATAMYQSLPPAATLREAILHEKSIMGPSIVKLLHEQERRHAGSWRRLLQDFSGDSQPAASLQEIGSLEQVTELINAVFAEYDELAEIAELPSPDFERRNAEFLQRVKASNPAASLLLPDIRTIVGKQRRHYARMQMLLAAIAVAERGPEALTDIKDPFGEGPFAYEKLSAGFRLTSQLLFDGQPVGLTIGQ